MRFKNLSILLLIIGMFHTSTILGQLAEKIEGHLDHPDLQNAEIGISILNENGNSLYSKNADRNLIPASLMKLVSSFTALETLGKNYQFSTSLSYTGEILADGNLTGDIVIFGNGDPSLGSERYQKRPQLMNVVDKMVAFIKKAGINCIDGKIICDASYYGSDGTVHSWSFDDVGNYYAANTWSVNIHENYYNLYFQLTEDRNEQPKILYHAPYISDLDFRNELKTGAPGSGDQAYIFGGPYNNNKIIRGSLPAGKNTYKIKGAIPNSPKLLAQLVSDNLSKNNISNLGAKVEFDHNTQEATTIGILQSPILNDLVQSANLESINLFCESFLAATGNGSREKGIRKAKEFLAKNGVDTSDISIVDGSGLSFWNEVSANDLAVLIQNLNEKYGSALEKYFPEAGKTGTLSYLFRNLEANGNLWAKTGSMNQVMNYAGFTKSKSGNMISFCLIFNRHKASNRKVRGILEQIMNTIYIEG